MNKELTMEKVIVFYNELLKEKNNKIPKPCKTYNVKFLRCNRNLKKDCQNDECKLIKFPK